jgi:hypothetical protein
MTCKQGELQIPRAAALVMTHSSNGRTALVVTA